MGNNNTIPGAPDTTPVFHLGLTMAGAASAGCYTAGVMDYLFEILSLWEKAKEGSLPAEWDGIKPYIPQHKVMIDAMGGTSAGGMTTIMAAIYALKGKSNPVTRPDTTLQRKNNLLYDSWVLMGDEEGKDTLIEKVFSTADLDRTGKLESLLNADFLDAICEDAFKDDNVDKTPFPFIAPDMELVLSHTMLRSIPLTIDFGTPLSVKHRTAQTPSYSSHEHFTISHFRRDYDPANPLHKDHYLPLDPFGAGAPVMKLATKATGAFPVGLRYREFFHDELSAAYLKNTTEAIAFNRLSGKPGGNERKVQFPPNFPESFKFISIDGGAINNEPFGEIMSILRGRHGSPVNGNYYTYGMVMIDPFPDLPRSNRYSQPEDLFGVVPAIIGTLWDQSKVKRAELLDAYSYDYCRGQLYPLKWTDPKQRITDDYPVACGAAMAFSGFLDVNFRKHDFFLGRNNARNFFRALFCLEYHRDDANPANNIIHPIHEHWTPEMVKLLGRTINGKTYLPIVPDMYYLRNEMEKKPSDLYHYDMPDKPKYDPAVLLALKAKFTTRFQKILELSYRKMNPGEVPLATAVDQLIRQHFDTGWGKQFINKMGKWLTRIGFLLFKKRIAGKLARNAIAWVLKDLEERDLLKK